MARKKNEDGETTVAGRTAFRMDDQGVINFGVDAEGNPYSAENSPKKGDATKERWSVYRDGMTVAEALEAGLTRSNIRRDRRAGYITITNPEKPVEESDAEGAE